MERPARTVPADAHWLDALPDHPACQVGPGGRRHLWLRVGLPDLPAPVAVPADCAAGSTRSPHRAGTPGRSGRRAGQLRELAGQVWRPWALLTAEAEKTRVLHRQLFDLMHQLDMAAATTELVWGHGILETVIGEHAGPLPAGRHRRC